MSPNLQLLGACQLAFCAILIGGGAGRAQTLDFSEYDNGPYTSSVYTLNNATDGNAVFAFARAANGALTPIGSFPTGGLGVGGVQNVTHNQGALALSNDRHWLIAVNPGSNDVTVFAVLGAQLLAVSKAPSGGVEPVSVTIHNNLVYVVNTASSNIAGFRLDESGQLHPLPGSIRPLSQASAAPAQILFSPDGQKLVVTERLTQKIVVYTVGPNGLPGANPTVNTSVGASPFGFDFVRDQTLVVSEAQNGTPNASSVSSYLLRPNGSFSVISASVPTHETAACWISRTPGGQYVYSIDTDSQAITGYSVRGAGVLAPLKPNAPTALLAPGSGPIDSAISPDGRFLYVLAVGSGGSIFGWHINNDGSLALLPSNPVSGLTYSATGLVVR